jgi:hypothetical protein
VRDKALFSDGTHVQMVLCVKKFQLSPDFFGVGKEEEEKVEQSTKMMKTKIKRHFLPVF